MQKSHHMFLDNSLTGSGCKNFIISGSGRVKYFKLFDLAVAKLQNSKIVASGWVIEFMLLQTSSNTLMFIKTSECFLRVRVPY